MQRGFTQYVVQGGGLTGEKGPGGGKGPSKCAAEQFVTIVARVLNGSLDVRTTEDWRNGETAIFFTGQQ